MSGKIDEATGRAKEAVGDLTDDEKLQREGQTDQAAGSVKEKISEASEWVEKKVDQAKDKVDRS